MPTKSIFFPLWFAICRRIRKRSAAKEKKKKKERGWYWERQRDRERKRNFKRGILNVQLLLSRPLWINFTQALPDPPTNYLLRANRSNGSTRCKQFQLNSLKLNSEGDIIRWYSLLVFLLFHMRVCFVLTVSSLPYGSDCFNLFISETRKESERERERERERGTFTELSNIRTFPFGIAFLIWAFHFVKFLKQRTKK